MIRENQRLFNVINVIIDILVVFISCFIIDNGLFTRITTLSFNYSQNVYLQFFVFLVPSYIFLYFMFNLYTPQRTNRSVFTESSAIAQVNLVEFFFLIAISSMGLIETSQGFLLCFLVVNVIVATFERAILRGILRLLRAHGFNIKYILIIGAGDLGTKLVDTINLNTYLGYKIMGFLDDNIEGTVNGVKVIGKVTDLESTISSNMVDRVIVSISPRHYEVLSSVISSCEKMGVRADIIPDYYRYITAHPSIELIDNIPLISVRYLPLDITYNRFIKRFLEVVFVIVVSIVISPLLLAVAVAVKLSSPGPIIYKQERVGENGRVFMIYKFRSMRAENEYIDETKWTQKNDPRITNVGHFIRKMSIDELPQFYNILKGDMSLIGPRPERPFFVRKFRESVPKYMIKHHVRPGMTGWAQINGYRGNTSIVKRIEYDIYYVENWSLLLDLRIFLKTIPTLLDDKNAY